MPTAEEKLKQIADILSIATDATLPAPDAPKAYDLPPLAADQATVDGVTFNKDGSLWVRSLTRGPDGQLDGNTKPEAIIFGYISPVKTPEIWDFAAKTLTPEGYAKWDAEWKANPFGLYRADPRDLIHKGVLNLMSFSYLLQPVRTLVQ